MRRAWRPSDGLDSLRDRRPSDGRVEAVGKKGGSAAERAPEGVKETNAVVGGREHTGEGSLGWQRSWGDDAAGRTVFHSSPAALAPA